jgi:opacity protein-like surface antigen
MKIAPSAAVLLLVAMAGASAVAHPRPFYHRHVHHAPPPVVVVPAPPPRAVRVYSPPPVVVVEEPVRQHYVPFGIGIRGSGVALEGNKLFLSDLENPAMGGVGISLRSRFDDHWGLEVAADWLGGASADFFQQSVPITASALFYLFPESRIQPYAVAGLGVQFTELDYADGLFTYNLTEAIGHAGLGVEIALSDHFKLHTDVRFLGVYKGLGDRVEVQGQCHANGGGSLCSGLSSFDPNDRFNVGIQFLAAASYYF